MKTVASLDMTDKVKEIFTSYLEKNGQRKTPERFKILEEIYQRDDHFDAETLYFDLRNRDYPVSRATVYNTLELLLSCDLIRRHQFGPGQARYEKSYGSRQHDHLICMDCQRVLEFCDPRLQQIQATMGELLHFSIAHHSLTMYGNCTREDCEHKGSALN